MTIIPDNSREAEESVLGALMIDPESNSGIIDDLTPDLFKDQTRQQIASAMKALKAKGTEIDLLTVHDYLDSSQSGADIEYLSQLCEETHGITPSKVAAYVDILRDRRTRRQIITSAQEAVQAAQDVIEIDECVNLTQSLFTGLSTGAGYSTETAEDLMARLSIVLDQRCDRKGNLSGLTWGFTDLDEFTGGIIPGLHTIGARPKMGKTSLLMNIIEANAVHDVPCLVASFEMPALQLGDKMVSSVSGVAFDLVKNPNKIMDNGVLNQIVTGINVITKMPIEFIDRSNAHIDKLCSSIRAWANRVSKRPRREGDDTPPGLVGIDYLQLMEFVKKDRHDLSVADATKKLKNLSGEIGMPILLLTQLNRGLENRTDKRPVPADTRDSGSIEQDSDTLIFIYRDEVYNEDTQDKGIAEINFAIARHHEAKRAFLAVQFDRQRFRNLSPDYRRSDYD